MPVLTTLIPDLIGNRLTGIRDHRPVCFADDEHVLAFHLVRPTAGRRAAPDSGYLAAHVPTTVASITGYDDAGAEWFVLVQWLTITDAIGILDPHALLGWSLGRGLAADAGAEVIQARTLDTNGLRDLFLRDGAEPDGIAGLSTRDLLLVALAELTGAHLSDLLALGASACAFPDETHVCQANPALDVLARWSVHGPGAA